MGDIRRMNFAALDLNLLRVFDALMATRSVTRAGERIGLSQPAVSSALGRLRHVTGDELFVRDGNSMAPTPQAEAMQAPVRDALRQIEEALAAVAGFDPATSSQSFMVIGSDYFSTLLMPGLIAAALAEAPGVTLQMTDCPSNAVFARLSDGAADLAVDRALETPDWIASKLLFRSYIVAVARRGDPALARAGVRPGERIPAELFCELPQAILSKDGSRAGSVDGALREQGMTRRIAATLPHFQAVALSAASGAVIGNLPVHFAHHVAARLDLDLYLPPFDPPVLDVRMYWHRRMERDRANIWLRGHAAATLQNQARQPVPETPRTDGLSWETPVSRS
jgi:DNA-binding transcriptional LysR family regulator